MKIALAQINSILGDFASNREKILEFAKRAIDHDCDLIVFPEHALFGYLPNDLLERESIVADQMAELKKLEKQWPRGILGLVGCVTPVTPKVRKGATASTKLGEPLSAKRFFNSAALLERKKTTRFFHKERLPAYDVFDETRHLAVGSMTKGRVVLRINSKKLNVQISICEDIWGWGDSANPIKKLPRTGIDAVINLSASPFTKTKLKSRMAVIQQTAQHFRAPLLYVNMVGAQDEVLFDGRSVVVDAKGLRVDGLDAFEEGLGFFDVKSKKFTRSTSSKPASRAADGSVELLRQALVTGIRDFAIKTGLNRAHFGLSGGIDSAVVACLAVEALGSKSVTAVALPGPFSSPKSLTLAQTLAKNLSIRCLEIPIGKSYDVLRESFEAGTEALEFGLVHENLQARIRGVLLMALANKESSLLLSTGNKSEYAAGYSTLYGDQCGGLAPLGDLLKREVYKLAELYNKEREIIPHGIVDRPPSAELRADQKDSDSLPPYEDLDRAVENVIEHRGTAKTETEKFVLRASLKSEFKRWQAPPILKVSEHAFGRGRRMPIAHRAKS